MHALTKPFMGLSKGSSEALDRFIMERSQTEVREVPANPPQIKVVPKHLMPPSASQSVGAGHMNPPTVGTPLDKEPGRHARPPAHRPIQTPPEQTQQRSLEKMRLLRSMQANGQLQERIKALTIENANLKSRMQMLEKVLKDRGIVLDG